MSSILVRDMSEEDEYFVSTCSHVNESEEIDAAGLKRLAWLKGMSEMGLRVKVAASGGRPVGFLYAMPIEVSPWDLIGKDLLAMPCLWVIRDRGGRGAGKALIAAAEEEVRRQGRRGLATTGYYWDFWFMPATYLEKLGFQAAERKDEAAALWKPLEPGAEPPRMITRCYEFRPMTGKVVVDLFWNPICLTSVVEAQRVRDVAAEFGDRVELREYRADDRSTLLEYGAPRAIFIDGKEISWGYEAPREGIRTAIAEALAGLPPGSMSQNPRHG